MPHPCKVLSHKLPGEKPDLALSAHAFWDLLTQDSEADWLLLWPKEALAQTVSALPRSALLSLRPTSHEEAPGLRTCDLGRNET